MLKQIWPSGTSDSVFEMYLAHSIYLSSQPWTKKREPWCRHLATATKCHKITPLQILNMIIQFEPFKLAKLSTIYCRTLFESDFDRTKYLVGHWHSNIPQPYFDIWSPVLMRLQISQRFYRILIFKSWSSMQKATFWAKILNNFVLVILL